MWLYAGEDGLSLPGQHLPLFPYPRLVVVHGCIKKLQGQSVLELCKHCRVIFLILGLSSEFSKLGDVMANITPFHLQFVQLHCCLIMGIHVGPILDEVLLKFISDIKVGWCWYWSSYNPHFNTLFPFCHSSSLNKGEGVGHLLVRVLHDWGCIVKKLVEFQLVHKFIGLDSITGKYVQFLSFYSFIWIVLSNWCLCWRLWWNSPPTSPSTSISATSSAFTSST